MELLIVLADDLTGAADTGIQFLSDGKPVYLVRDSNLRDVCNAGFRIAPDVLSVYTGSRSLNGKAAARRVEKAAAVLGKLKSGIIYKKLDSCFRGNIGEEVDAMLDTLQFRTCFLAPAFPEQGRITRNGIHYLHGVPVSETEMGNDPVTPVKDSNLVHLLSTKSRKRIGSIDVSDYGNGLEFVKSKIQTQLDKGCRYIVFDAIEQSHLDLVAKLGNSFSDTLFAGSAGLAASVAKRLKCGGPPAVVHQPQASGTSNMLWVCGSASEKTAQQVKQLLTESNCLNFALDGGLLVNTKNKKELQQLAVKASAMLKRDSVVIYISPGSGQDFDHKAERVLKGLLRFTMELLRLQRPFCLFLSGGDTADAVLHETGVKYMRLEQELLPGVVQGSCFGGLLDHLPVVSKAGSFGSPDTLLQVLQKITSIGGHIR